MDGAAGREEMLTDSVEPKVLGTKANEGKFRSGITARRSRVRMTVALRKGADFCLNNLRKSQPIMRTAID